MERREAPGRWRTPFGGTLRSVRRTPLAEACEPFGARAQRLPALHQRARPHEARARKCARPRTHTDGHVTEKGVQLSPACEQWMLLPAKTHPRSKTPALLRLKKNPSRIDPTWVGSTRDATGTQRNAYGRQAYSSSASSSSSFSAARICSARRPEFCRTAASILAAISGLFRRKVLAFSRPWPMRWLS
jgi:hypothetical protein